MEKNFVENERKNLSEWCKVGNAVRERDMVSEKEWGGHFENRKKAMIRAMCEIKLKK